MKEKEYIQKIKETLEEEGYYNCGIVMTKIIEAGCENKYKVKIHHKKINFLTDEEKERLRGTLLSMDFPLKNSVLLYEFFIA